MRKSAISVKTRSLPAAETLQRRNVLHLWLRSLGHHTRRSRRSTFNWRRKEVWPLVVVERQRPSAVHVAVGQRVPKERLAQR